MSVHAAIVGIVTGDLKNAMLLVAFGTGLGECVDMEHARKAFEMTPTRRWCLMRRRGGPRHL